MTTILLFVAGVVALMYLGAPMLIRFTLKLKARPRVLVVEIDHMPPDVYEYFGGITAGLEACGFSPVAYISMPDQVPNVVPYVVLWLNRSAGQAATGVVMYANAGGRIRVKRYTEFLTKVSDGMTVLTNNSTDLSSFKRSPMKDTLWAEAAQDIERLYKLHVSRERRLVQATAPRYIPADGEEIASFMEAVEFDLRRQATLGYLHEAEPDVYRPTLVGAYMMTWGELPPVKQIRRVFVRARARREIREAEGHLAVQPANVPITHVSPYRRPG